MVSLPATRYQLIIIPQPPLLGHHLGRTPMHRQLLHTAGGPRVFFVVLKIAHVVSGERHLSNQWVVADVNVGWRTTNH